MKYRLKKIFIGIAKHRIPLLWLESHRQDLDFQKDSAMGINAASVCQELLKGKKDPVLVAVIDTGFETITF